MKYNHNKSLVSIGRVLRKNMTKEERHLWYDFLRGYSIRFIRQKIIGNYIVDFYCAKLKLIIEIDGEQHYIDESIVYEKRRTEFLENSGYKLLRFYNSDINKKIKDVEKTVFALCEERAKELELDIIVTYK